MRTLEQEPRACQLGDWPWATHFALPDFHFFMWKMSIIEWLYILLWGYMENLDISFQYSRDSIKAGQNRPPEFSFTVWIQGSYLNDTIPEGSILKVEGSLFIVARIVNTTGIWGRGKDAWVWLWAWRSRIARRKGELRASLQALKCPTRLHSTNIIKISIF